MALLKFYRLLHLFFSQVLHEILCLIKLLEEFYQSKQDIARLQAIDDEFHAAICRLSKRNVINDTLIPLHRKTRLYRKIAMEDQERSPKTLREHREIYQAIISGNGALAKDLTGRHIENAKIHMMGCVNING